VRETIGKITPPITPATNCAEPTVPVWSTSAAAE
jgi:hypothetical protein